LSTENEILFKWKWKDFAGFWQKYRPETNVKAFNKWDSIGTYFKGVGVLVKLKLIDLNLVDEIDRYGCEDNRIAAYLSSRVLARKCERTRKRTLL
jgi:hypothetical protein